VTSATGKERSLENEIKLFSSSLTLRPFKLECLKVENFSAESDIQEEGGKLKLNLGTVVCS
jgi:hypothetical protein